MRLLVLIEGTVGLILRLLYGAGMRIVECLCLRVKDVDFARSETSYASGKVSRTGLGHPHVAATMSYTHVLNQGGRGVRSPLDALV